MKLLNGKPLNIIELPMPLPVNVRGSKASGIVWKFYICNRYVIVPTFRGKNDHRALEILKQAMPQHEIIGIDSTDIIWGLGSFHCLSQQEPED